MTVLSSDAVIVRRTVTSNEEDSEVVPVRTRFCVFVRDRTRVMVTESDSLISSLTVIVGVLE